MTVVALGCSGQETQGEPNEQANGGSDNQEGEATSDYPTKPIEVIVPAGAGGDTDRNTRALARYLEDELGQSIVVSNVTGAGGTVATRQVLDSDPDGYTVLAFHDSILLNYILGLADFSFQDFEVAGVSVQDQGNTFLINGDSEFETLDELIEFAKDNPKELSIATEFGAHTHLQLLAFEEATGVDFNIVDVGGASDKITALLGGQVDVNPTQLGLVKDYLASGDMRSLGVFAEERLNAMPDVPTFKEQGVDVIFNKSFLWAFPPGTPEEVVNAFSEAMEKTVTENEEYRAELENHVVTPNFMGPEEAIQHLAETQEFYSELHAE
ncbi:tripartite tricarboxylate transporter substrate binding protein [Desertibacillus haloalkaliphilus]|nr:tripartite tricarboxylate transporter substrate binding protein [Desertibacillus haloalkaliphilus]